MDQMIDAIKRILKHFTDDAVAHGKLGLRYNQYWTEEIIYRLDNEGKRHGFEVFIRSGSEEWVPDLCWTETEGGFLKSIPLIVICEWRSSPVIERRFCTLLGARADLRVVLLDATFPESPAGYSKTWAKEKIPQLMEQVKQFDKTVPTDTYLFCIWCRDAGESDWYFDKVSTP